MFGTSHNRTLHRTVVILRITHSVEPLLTERGTSRNSNSLRRTDFTSTLPDHFESRKLLSLLRRLYHPLFEFVEREVTGEVRNRLQNYLILALLKSLVHDTT